MTCRMLLCAVHQSGVGCCAMDFKMRGARSAARDIRYAADSAAKVDIAAGPRWAMSHESTCGAVASMSWARRRAHALPWRKSTSVRLLLALDNEPLLGACLKIIKLLAEAWQVYKRMRISGFARLKQVFCFGEPRREAMCRKVQLHGARAILREGTDAL